MLQIREDRDTNCTRYYTTAQPTTLMKHCNQVGQENVYKIYATMVLASDSGHKDSSAISIRNLVVDKE